MNEGFVRLGRALNTRKVVGLYFVDNNESLKFLNK